MGEWATVRLLLPPSGYAPEQKSGPQEVGLTAEGDNDALAGPFLVECMRGSVSLDVDAREGRRGYPAASRSLHGASRFRKFNESPRPSGASESVGIVAPDHASRSRYREETSRVLQHIDLTDAQPSRCLR